MNQVAFAQSVERGLSDADMAFHAAQQHGIAVTGDALEQGAECIAGKAGEHLLVNRLGSGQQRGNLRDGVTEAAGILGTHEHWNFQDAGKANEQLRVLYQSLFFEDRLDQLFLNVNDDEGAALRLERAAGDFGVIGGELLNAAGGHDHILPANDTSVSPQQLKPSSVRRLNRSGEPLWHPEVPAREDRRGRPSSRVIAQGRAAPCAEHLPLACVILLRNRVPQHAGHSSFAERKIMFKSLCSPKLKLFFAVLISAILTAAYSLPATAQDQNADPPGRVARLNLIQGSISFEPAGEQDWVEANHNRPLTTGDNLWADKDSRGELHINSTVLRVGAETSISFLNLDDNVAQIQVAQGTMEIHVRHIDQDQSYEVDTPNFAFSILAPGIYRFDVDPSGQNTSVTVRTGNGEATAGGQGYTVVAGQQGLFTGSADQVSFSVQGAPAPDDFDQWCSQRDEHEDHSASARYVSRDMTGYDDLDEYGQWRQDPTYGAVWVPSGVPGGWAPYHSGHWAYVAPWGWTWVDEAPWGFAPFHYGRWAYVGGYWGWVPGPVAVRPVYAPALVAFVGGGWGVTLAIGGGQGVAWFALGPRDVFIPPYHVSPAYVTNINVTNTTVINRTTVVNVYNNYTVNHVTNITYVNRNAPGAVIAVNRDAFVSARPVAAAAIKVSPQELQHPQVIKTAAPLKPTPAARLGGNAPVKPTARPPAALASHPVVTKRAPSPHAAPIGKPAPVKAVAAVHPAVPTPKPGQPAARPGAPAGKPGTPPAKPGEPAAKAPAPAGRPVPRPPQPGAKTAAPRPEQPAKPAAPATREEAHPVGPTSREAAPKPPAREAAPKPPARPAEPVQREAAPKPGERPAARPAAPEAKPKSPPPPKKDEKEKRPE